MSNCTAGIQPNPDISGIGIRVSIYTGTLLLAMIPQLAATMPLVAALATNSGLNGMAVLITAIVQTAQGQLDLFHAIFILHLLTFLGISVAPTGNYRGNVTIRSVLTTITWMLCLIAHLAFALYVWGTAPSFGSQPDCNNLVKYVFVFKTVRATVKWLRVLWIVALSLGAAGALIAFSCLCCYARRSANDYLGHADDGDDDDDGRAAVPSSSNEGVFGRIIAAVYGVVTLELTVKRNNIAGENVWSFGQILAVILLFSSLNEVIHFIMGLWGRKDR